jgi:hypothetical protein
MMIAIDCRLTPDELDEVEARLNAIWPRLEREDKDTSVYRRAALVKAIDLAVAARRGVWDAQVHAPKREPVNAVKSVTQLANRMHHHHGCL